MLASAWVVKSLSSDSKDIVTYHNLPILPMPLLRDEEMARPIPPVPAEVLFGRDTGRDTNTTATGIFFAVITFSLP